MFGDPLIIADQFHIMPQVYWALDEVFEKVQRTVDKKTCIHKKRRKKLWWKCPYKLSEEGQEKGKRLLQIHPRPRKAILFLSAIFHKNNKISALG